MIGAAAKETHTAVRRLLVPGAYDLHLIERLAGFLELDSAGLQQQDLFTGRNKFQSQGDAGGAGAHNANVCFDLRCFGNGIKIREHKPTPAAATIKRTR
jgi:hypothetical protein